MPTKELTQHQARVGRGSLRRCCPLDFAGSQPELEWTIEIPGPAVHPGKKSKPALLGTKSSFSRVTIAARIQEFFLAPLACNEKVEVNTGRSHPGSGTVKREPGFHRPRIPGPRASNRALVVGPVREPGQENTYARPSRDSERSALISWPIPRAPRHDFPVRHVPAGSFPIPCRK